MKWFRIYWNNGKDVSSFCLKNIKQAKAIAKQYPNVIAIKKS